MEKKNVVKKIFKVIGVIVLIAFVLFMVNTIRKLVIIKEIQRTASQYTSSTNYHVKSVAKDSSEYTITIDSYVKNDKKLMIITRNKREETLNKISTYYKGESQDMFFDSPQEKRANLDTDEEVLFIPNLYDYFGEQSKFVLFCSAISSQINTITYNGKKCYRVTNFPSLSHLQDANDNTSEVYIDKETGLVVRTHFGNTISEREYEFGNVQDEIFVEPDLKEYGVIKK